MQKFKQKSRAMWKIWVFFVHPCLGVSLHYLKAPNKTKL